MPEFVFERGVSDSRIPAELDRSTPIWRYQDLPKFVWTLANNSLWFARGDTFEDRFEGSTTQAVRNLYSQELEAVVKDAAPGFVTEAMAWMTTQRRASKQNNVVNCWHMNEHESAAMWKLYASAGQGVAIRSSIDRLLQSLPAGRASHPTDGSAGIRLLADTSNRDSRGVSKVIAIDFGPVTYADYSDPVLTRRPGSREEYFRKRKSFEHEREFRALAFALAVNSEGHVDLAVPVFPDGGVAVPVDLDVLVEGLFVVPGAPSWFTQTVEATIERFGKRFPVRQSRLDEDPIF